MGNYLNPGNSGFAGIRNDIYVDKSGLIGLINQTIDTPRRMTCVSRPRRFGKSFAAQMLCAYYDKTCDSAGLFDGLEIAGDAQFRDYLNRYDVIYLDMTGVIGETSIEDIIPYIQRNVTQELKEQYPELKAAEGFTATLANATAAAGNKFIMIIDEWDAPIREAKDCPDLQRKYLEFLRALFKNSGMTSKIFAAAYMTGILPIKKDSSQSAISDFQEYSMLKPRQFAEYVGFTEEEVSKLCRDYGCDFKKMKLWYDGYSFRDLAAVYNPNSVMKAIHNDDFDSYWTQTSAAESLMGYISLDFDGLSRTVAGLIGGAETKVDTKGFANDLVTYSDEYIMFEELPAGAGYADIVYLPKRDSVLPVLIVELKWSQSGENALEQIRDRRYPAAFKSYGSDILLVGISYDREAAAGNRKHWCRIEKYRELPSD